MASSGNEKYMGIERNIFSDGYLYFLKHKDKPNTDEAWESIIEDANKLYAKYKKYPFAREIFSSVVTQLEFKIKGVNTKGETYDNWDKYLGDYKNFTSFN